MAVTADYETLMRQAPMTVSVYLRGAVHNIDQLFGDGYAAKHPDLVSAFISACSADFHSGMLALIVQDASAEIGSSIAEIGANIEKVSDAIADR